MKSATHKRTYITKDGLTMSEEVDNSNFASTIRRYLIPRLKATVGNPFDPIPTSYREYRFDGIENQEDKSLINALYYEV